MDFHFQISLNVVMLTCMRASNCVTTQMVHIAASALKVTNLTVMDSHAQAKINIIIVSYSNDIMHIFFRY